jgi:cytoskeletal protein CcmA (bactofilin family)
MDKIKTTSSQATVIGPQTHVKGALEGDEDLHVVGRVDGNITLTKSLIVDPAGIVVADVQVAKAIISGTVVGNVTATELVHITEQGRVVGDLAAPRVVLVDGASFRGNVDMGDMESSRSERPAAAVKPVARPAVKEPPVAPKPAPRPAPPPRRVVEAPKVVAKPAPPRPAPLEKRAEAAAQAVAQAAKAKEPPPAPKPRIATLPAAGEEPEETTARGSGTFSSLRPPKPPTTAGKKSKVRRK